MQPGPGADEGSRLPFEEGSFAVDAPAVASQVAVCPDHAVAGDDESDRVRRTGSGHGPSSLGPADGRRDFGVRARRSVGDGAQGVPDPPLELAGAYVQGEVEPRRAPVQIVPQCLDPGREALGVGPDLGERELVPERRGERFGLVSEAHHAHPPLRTGDEQVAHVAREDAVADAGTVHVVSSHGRPGGAGCTGRIGPEATAGWPFSDAVTGAPERRLPPQMWMARS